MSKESKKSKCAPARISDTAAAAAINVDVPAAAATVLGALVRLEAMRDEIVRNLPKFPIAMLDRLRS